MSYPVTLSQGWSRLAEDVDAEIARARAKFPQPDFLTTAMTEEFGEAVRAVLEHMAKGQTLGLRLDVRKELVQAIAMAVRLEIEGDPIHRLPGSEE